MRTAPRKAISFSVALLGLLFLCAAAGAVDPPGGSPPSTDAATQPGDQNADLRSEVRELKQLVQQQQARINALERQQVHTEMAPGVGSMTDLLSSGGVVADPTAQAAPAPQPPPQTANVQTDQNAGSSDTRIRNLERRIQVCKRLLRLLQTLVHRRSVEVCRCGGFELDAAGKVRDRTREISKLLLRYSLIQICDAVGPALRGVVFEVTMALFRSIRGQ